MKFGRRALGISSFVLLAAGLSPLSAQIANLPATLSFRRIDSVVVPFQGTVPYPSFEPQMRPVLDLSGTWKKFRFTADHNLTLKARDTTTYAALLTEGGGKHLPSYNDQAWATKDLPAVENAMRAYPQVPEYYQNGVWYRRAFTVPDTLIGKTAVLKFLAVNYVADVWLNGAYLGYHEGGYTPFAFNVSSILRSDTTNVLAVRVDNPPWNPGHVQDVSSERRIDIVPYYTVDWFNYTGIIHDVSIEFADPVSIPRVNIVPLDAQGNLQVGVTVWNNSGQAQALDLAVQIFEAVVDSSTIDNPVSAGLIGSPAALSGSTQTSLSVPGDSCRGWNTRLSVLAPKLWTPKTPNLYILKALLSYGGHTVDSFATQFGIRTVTTSGSRLLMNGMPVFLPGTARHEDHPTYGRSLPLGVIASDLKTVKGLNVAFLRTAHYPNHPYTYLMADRLGLSVLEEIPVWWFDTDNAWTIQNMLRHIHTQMFREMVFRDYNRPSIIAWSTCNECLATTGRQTFIQAINTELDASYPDGRLVTQSAAADRPGAGDPTQTSCDVAGWTMYFGIFHGGTYYDGTRQFLQSGHTAQPNKPIFDTEFGYWSAENMSQAAKQVTVLDSTFMAFAEVSILDSTGAVNPNGFLAATTWWCAFDWYTCQQPSGYESMGVYQMDRVTAKPVAAALANTYAPYYANLFTTGVQKEPGMGRAIVFGLEQNYPNPFNPTTGIRFQVSEVCDVRLVVYDLLGREVAELVNERKVPGRYDVNFDGARLSSGVYFYKLTAGPGQQTRKMVILR